MDQKNNLPKATSSDLVRIDFRKILFRMLSYWWLFILCFGIAIACGNLYLRYATFEYSARAILLIKDAGDSGEFSASDILNGSDALGGGKSMDNEIQILKSLTLMEKVVERLQLHIRYFRLGNVKETELYKESPFLLTDHQFSKDLPFGVSFFVEMGDYQTFLLKQNEEEPGVKCAFGVPFENEYGKFTINLNPNIAVLKGIYRLSIGKNMGNAYSYKSRLNVNRIGDYSGSSVLQLSILDPVPQKASDILNTLIDIYNEEEIKDENKIFENTLEFIDRRVTDLVSELDSVEGGIQRFKSSNQIISEDASSSMDYTLGELRNSLQQISNYEIQQNLLQSIETFLLRDNFKFELIPANLAAENPALGGLVGEYNTMVIRNKQMAISASEKNPARIALEDQIGDMKDLILETIQNQKRDLQIPIQEIEENIQDLKKSMSSIPGIEKKLLEKMRTQEVKEQLFLFLLQKREETALSEAITTAKSRTIDRARTPQFPVYPQPRLIMISSGIIGFIVPMLLVLALGLFENKVDSEETIKELTSIPIIGRIAQKKGDKNIVVKYGSRSAVNEMFRLLRTNLNFINHGKTKQTILLTSSISGEGKTFIALNLGITLALSGKKVLLLGLDLRKPKLATYLGAPQGKGITNFLVGQNSLEEIIQPYKDNENLFFITSGPTPPNPAELILSEQMETLLEKSIEQFDYVLIDTPPMGLVSDALLLRKHVDNILVIVRHKFTRKAMLKSMESMYENGELQNANIVLNGVKQGKKYYGYGGYYYGKNQGYYVEED